MREQIRQTDIKEGELAKEKKKQEQVAPEVAPDTNETQRVASPVNENEIPATQQDGSQPFEEEYPDNQQGLWGSRDFASPEKSPAETVPGTDSQLPQKDSVSTPVRSQRPPPEASPPVTKPYMRNRDTREALTPTEPEMSPVKTDDYPLLVEDSPAGKQLDDTWFKKMAAHKYLMNCIRVCLAKLKRIYLASMGMKSFLQGCFMMCQFCFDHKNQTLRIYLVNIFALGTPLSKRRVQRRPHYSNIQIHICIYVNIYIYAHLHI